MAAAAAELAEALAAEDAEVKTELATEVTLGNTEEIGAVGALPLGLVRIPLVRSVAESVTEMGRGDGGPRIGSVDVELVIW